MSFPHLSTLVIFACSCTLHAQTSAPPAGEREIGLRQIPANTWSDQKRIWSYPAHAFKPKPLLAAGLIAGATAALIATDARTGAAFHNTNTFQTFNTAMNGTATGVAIGLAPPVLYVVGQIGKSSYDKKTAILAGQALIDTEILTLALKDIGRRERPSDYPANQPRLSDSWFHGSGSYLTGVGGFPSNHAIAAFSVATVFSRRYGRRHRWVPIAAYGAAGLIGFSRLTQSAHFASDVFVGAALGYSIGRFVVVR